jgi:RNA polymerase primary sigma factor
MNDIDLYENLDRLKKTLKDSPVLSQTEERVLIDVMRDETKPERVRLLARNKLVKSHSRLIYSVAKMKANKNPIAIPDLFQAGVMGLLRAADDYDPNKRLGGKKCRFTSYAIWWIRQKMNEEIYRYNDAVHVPMYGKYMMMKKLRENHLDASDERSEDFIRATAPVMSFDAKVNGGSQTSGMDETGLTLGDIIAGDCGEFANRAVDVELDKKLGEVLREHCSEYEYDMIREIYLYRMSQDDVGQRRGLSGERIRQIRTRALRRVASAMKKFMQEKNVVYDKTSDECNIDAIFNPENYK